MIEYMVKKEMRSFLNTDIFEELLMEIVEDEEEVRVIGKLDFIWETALDLHIQRDVNIGYLEYDEWEKDADYLLTVYKEDNKLYVEQVDYGDLELFGKVFVYHDSYSRIKHSVDEDEEFELIDFAFLGDKCENCEPSRFIDGNFVMYCIPVCMTDIIDDINNRYHDLWDD